MSTSEYRERELKFDVPDGWQLPNPTVLVPDGGSLEREVVSLESTYFDSPARDLLSARVTLRRRRGDLDSGWQLKIPDGDARIEIRHPLGSGRGVPAALRELTLGLRAGAALAPVMTLNTERGIHRILDAGGAALAEIVVDGVQSVPHVAAARPERWREVEVELVGGDEALLDRAAQWLTQRGARPAAVASKLARALDFAADDDAGPEPDQQAGAQAADAGTLAALVSRYLDRQLDRLLSGDLELRRGHEAIRPTRLASRRYRSALRVYAGLLDRPRAEALDAELAWYAAALGEVRDRQVLRTHLDDAVAELAPELVWGPVAERLHRTLDAELDGARAALDRVMRSRRYFALLRELRRWQAELPVARDEPASAVAGYLAQARRALKRRLHEAARPARPDEHGAAMHRARKAAKRARYAAELSEPELGPAGRRVARRAKRVQDRLGRRQDSVIAAEFLLRAAAAASDEPDGTAFTFGLLYERELRRARRAEH